MFQLENLKKKPLSLAIGVFDGVHLGHQEILKAMLVNSAATGAVPTALTFDPHPRQVLRPDEHPTLLIPLAERIRLLRVYGAEEVAVAPFNQTLATLSPEDFLQQLCREHRIKAIAVGENWRFGRNGAGDSKILREFCDRNDIKLAVVPLLKQGETLVCSSNIRLALAGGRIEFAEQLLGRKYRLYGIVTKGFGVAGHELDCPTANFEINCGIIPPDGVYAARTFLDNQTYNAIANIGVSPTFQRANPKRRIEIHLLGYHGNLYGSSLGLEFLQYLRSEKTFPGCEELRRQIAEDLKQAGEIFHHEQ